MTKYLRLLGYLRPYSLQAFLSVILMAAVGLLDAFRLLLIKPIFDHVLDPHAADGAISLFVIPGTHYHLDLRQIIPAHFHNDWAAVAFALVVSTLVKGLCDYGGTYLVNYAGFGMITDLRDDLYEAILRRSVSFFQKHATGTILSTLINDVERIQYAMSSVLSEFLQQFFTLIFTIVVVIGYGGKLAWILLIFLPVVITSARKIGRRVRQTTRKGQDKLAEIQNILHETVTGNRIVKAFNMELWETLRFKTAARRLFRANLRSVRAQAISSPLMDSIGAIAIALLLLVGRNQIKYGAMTEGAFFAFIIAVFKLYDPVRKFALFYNNFQTALGASSEIFNFMDEQDDVCEKPRALQLKGFHDSIRFENVGFAYSSDEGESQVLHEINLDVRCGEVVALVGHSGAGKSTMVNLVPRFFDVTTGRITIDGHDLRDVSLRSLREQIGKVTQETILFNDTVRNNIAYGQPDVSLPRVIDAAKAALANDFILNLPEGYDTVIGEKGFRLSGGERQRLAIARALLKNAPILILDEATSALDSESEALVQTALANLMAQRTSIVIAHRLSTVRRADRIAVIESGRITAIGPHEELLRISPTYQRLNKLQFADTSTGEREYSYTCRCKGDTMMTKDSSAVFGAPTSSPIYSMTGFARVSGRVSDSLGFTLGLKSVNHRFLDPQLRMPSGLESLEMRIRRLLKEKLVRGHVEFTLSLERNAEKSTQYNSTLVASYIAAFRAAAGEHSLAQQPDLNAILRLPGVLSAESYSIKDDVEALEAAVLGQLDPLIAALNVMRSQEGASLAAELSACLDRLSVLIDQVASMRQEVQGAYFERISQRVTALVSREMGGEFDRDRILQEVALLVERSDVDEEIARLRIHIEHFHSLLGGGGEVGKKTDFLLQEMNREANTLLSKTSGIAGNAANITELGLGMKAEIEKAREQVQNLE